MRYFMSLSFFFHFQRKLCGMQLTLDFSKPNDFHQCELHLRKTQHFTSYRIKLSSDDDVAVHILNIF